MSGRARTCPQEPALCPSKAQAALCSPAGAAGAATERVLAPKCTSYFHLMDVPEKRLQRGAGVGSAAGREGMLGSGAGQGEKAAWKRALLGWGWVWKQSWYVGVLVHEDVGPGSVLKQKGLIFFPSFEMVFLISWNMK